MSKERETKVNLSQRLGKTLVESDLSEITGNFLESVLKNGFTENELIKDIPILSSVIGLGKIYKTVSDYLFAEKLIAFLSELSKINPLERSKMISKVDADSKYSQRVGTKLLHIINNAQDNITSQFIGKLFRHFITGELTYPEFCKASLIINRIDYHDLQLFLDIPDHAYGRNGTEGLGLEEIDNFFIISGLCSAESKRAEVKKNFNSPFDDVYDMVGGETVIYRTLIGGKIYKLLNF